VLVVDAAISGATGVLLLAAGGMLAPVLAVSESLLRVAGAILIPFVGLVLYIATRGEVARGGVQLVIALNVAWVAASIMVLFNVDPSLLGYAFIVVQAIAVAAFAEFQYVGLRKAAATGG
jgi:hypothetical protein